MTVEFHDVKFLHQIFLDETFVLPKKISKRIQLHIKAARSLYPNAAYKMWSGVELRRLIKNNFPKDVLFAFDILTPYAYKSDLARYCLMYLFGGIYFDLSILMLNAWKIPKAYGVAAFYETYEGMECWASLQNSLLWSLPGRKEWLLAIERIVYNCKNKYYGPHDHYVTGAPVLGRSFASVLSNRVLDGCEDDQYVGEVRYLTPERFVQNVSFVTPDFLVVGLRNKDAAGDNSELGLVRGNNYCKLWKQKKVFSEEKHVWPAEDKHIILVGNRYTKKEKGIIYISNAKGRIFFGPYVDLPKGIYKVTLNFLPSTIYRSLLLDISSKNELHREFKVSYNSSQQKSKESFYFNFDEEKPAVEFRLSTYGDFLGAFSSIVVEKVNSLVWLMDNPFIYLADVGRKENDCIVVNNEEKGKIFFGPYVDLPAGRYVLELCFSHSQGNENLHLSVTAFWGKDLIREFKFTKNENMFEFDLQAEMSFVEFVLQTEGGFEGKITSLHLTKKEMGIPEEINETFHQKKKNIVKRIKKFL